MIFHVGYFYRYQIRLKSINILKNLMVIFNWSVCPMPNMNMDLFIVILTRKGFSRWYIFWNYELLRTLDQNYPHILTFSNTLCRWEVKKLRTGKEPFDRVVFHSSKMPSGPASYNLLANVITETLWYTGLDFYSNSSPLKKSLTISCWKIGKSDWKIRVKSHERCQWMGINVWHSNWWSGLWRKSFDDSYTKSRGMNLNLYCYACFNKIIIHFVRLFCWHFIRSL